MEPVWVLWKDRRIGSQPIFVFCPYVPLAEGQPHQIAFGYNFTVTVILLKLILAVLIW